MELNTISKGTWYTIANYLNYNFNKLSIAVGRLRGITITTFKGVYISEAELNRVNPSPNPGDYAFVIINSNSNFKVFYADLNEGWITDGGIYDPEVIIKDYIEMTALSDVVKDLEKDIKDYNERKYEGEGT